MEKYELDGEIYYYKDGKWVDGSFLAVPTVIMRKLNKLIVNSDEYKMKTAKELIEIINNAKGTDNLQLAGQALEDALDKANINQIRMILPRLSSWFRKQGESRKAIQVSKDYTEKYGKKVYSSALFTSIAAAYCDIDDYETAKKFADLAFNYNGGFSSLELSSVYGRIEKES